MGTIAITALVTVNSIVPGKATFTGSTIDTVGWLAVVGAGPDYDNSDAAIIASLLGASIDDCLQWQANVDGIPGPATGSIRFGFDQNTAIFSLDGAPAISFNSLPGGILITDLALSIDMPATQLLASDDLFCEFGGVNVPLSPGIGWSGTVVSSPISPLQFISKTLDFNCSGDAAGQAFGIQAFNFVLSGTYIQVTAQWTLETPNEPLSPGDPISVTSDPEDPDPLDMEQILTVNIAYIDANGDPQTINVPVDDWITVDPNLFIFLMPVFPSDMFTFQIVITSTQFSGSVPLGTLTTIYFISATGIYKLVADKRSDTLYIETSPGDTVDVKIPDPQFKTGYIGG